MFRKTMKADIQNDLVHIIMCLYIGYSARNLLLSIIQYTQYINAKNN